MDEVFFRLALAASFAMPFFNIPLIIKLIRRRSSEDLSRLWVSGVWISALLMLPWSFATKDMAYRTFSLVNFFFFSIVTFLTFKYRKRDGTSAP